MVAERQSGTSLVVAQAKWEMAAEVPAERRRSTPLFCGPPGTGSCLTHTQLDSIFQRLLRWVLKDEAEARMYSIHSFRCYLASALMAAGRSDAQIQIALRWASQEALQIYKVTNIEEYASWLLDAEKQVTTGLRAGALPRVRPPQHDHLDRAAAMLDADPDMRVRASAADAELAAGIQHAQDSGVADYDLTSWGA